MDANLRISNSEIFAILVWGTVDGAKELFRNNLVESYTLDLEHMDFVRSTLINCTESNIRYYCIESYDDINIFSVYCSILDGTRKGFYAVSLVFDSEKKLPDIFSVSDLDNLCDIFWHRFVSDNGSIRRSAETMPTAIKSTLTDAYSDKIHDFSNNNRWKLQRREESNTRKGNATGLLIYKDITELFSIFQFHYREDWVKYSRILIFSEADINANRITYPGNAFELITLKSYEPGYALQINIKDKKTALDVGGASVILRNSNGKSDRETLSQYSSSCNTRLLKTERITIIIDKTNYKHFEKTIAAFDIDEMDPNNSGNSQKSIDIEIEPIPKEYILILEIRNSDNNVLKNSSISTNKFNLTKNKINNGYELAKVREEDNVEITITCPGYIQYVINSADIAELISNNTIESKKITIPVILEADNTTPIIKEDGKKGDGKKGGGINGDGIKTTDKEYTLTIVPRRPWWWPIKPSSYTISKNGITISDKIARRGELNLTNLNVNDEIEIKLMYNSTLHRPYEINNEDIRNALSKSHNNKTIQIEYPVNKNKVTAEGKNVSVGINRNVIALFFTAFVALMFVVVVMVYRQDTPPPPPVDPYNSLIQSIDSAISSLKIIELNYSGHLDDSENINKLYELDSNKVNAYNIPNHNATKINIIDSVFHIYSKEKNEVLKNIAKKKKVDADAHHAETEPKVNYGKDPDKKTDKKEQKAKDKEEHDKIKGKDKTKSTSEAFEKILVAKANKILKDDLVGIRDPIHPYVDNLIESLEKYNKNNKYGELIDKLHRWERNNL